jgi:prepilin peptidase CpaA
MLAIYAILTCLMIAIILSDIMRYLIPNWLVLALLALYPVAVYVSSARPDWKTACLVCLITFAAGNVIFFLRLMGGGDIKLLTATALYAGSAGILDFIVYVAILGGLGSVVLLLMRALTPFVFSKIGKGAESIPRVLSDGAPVPYGVAIAGAFLFMLWNSKLPGLTL